jgi:hypothetical protein
VDYIGEWRIAWVFEDDVGGLLGQSREDGLGPAPSGIDDWEQWAACKAILDAYPDVERDRESFIWSTESSAKKALRIAKASLKGGQEKPMPEWALKALANGWKPPKGWKP